MSSYVKQITDSIEAKLAILLTSYSKAAFVWDLASNNAKTSKNAFRVIPGEASSVEGSMRTITLSQKFTVYLTTNFINKESNDLVQQAAIEELYNSLEIVTNEAMQRRFAIARIMSVSGVEMTAPEIDQENNTVTIGAAYSVFYRME